MVERLGQIVQAENAAHIVLLGDPVILSVVQEEMPKQLAEMVVDTVKMDTKATDQDVFTTTLDKMRELDAKTDAEKWSGSSSSTVHAVSPCSAPTPLSKRSPTGRWMNC